jgi:hypothetical protein
MVFFLRVAVLFVVCQHLLVELSFLLFALMLFRFFCPLLLLSFQSFIQSRIVELVLFIAVLVAFEAVVDVVVLIKAVLLCVLEGVPVAVRELCAGGLKMRVPAVWKRDWKPTA